MAGSTDGARIGEGGRGSGETVREELLFWPAGFADLSSRSFGEPDEARLECALPAGNDGLAGAVSIGGGIGLSVGVLQVASADPETAGSRAVPAAVAVAIGGVGAAVGTTMLHTCGVSDGGVISDTSVSMHSAGLGSITFPPENSMA